MTRGMERDAHALHIHGLTVGDRVEVHIPEAQLKQSPARFRGEVRAAAPPGMIAVSVSEESALDPVPRIDVKTTRGTMSP